MKILFVSDANGHEGANPFATLIQLNKPVTFDQLRDLEYKQIGVARRGGSYHEILVELAAKGYTWTEIAQTRWNDILRNLAYNKDFAHVYYLISGNY